MTLHIALDAMSGDNGPAIVVAAALRVLNETPELCIHMVGDEQTLQKLLEERGVAGDERLPIHHASEVVTMDEKPALALRNKKDSSMRVAINLVKDDIASACVSAGNTGALMATARFVLRMLPGIDRPAICSTLPGITHESHLLDLGANVDSSSEQLYQFAVMGSALVSALEDKESPTVGLLNVGAEQIKGNERVKYASTLLDESGLNYIGFVEGDDIYRGEVDVIVCDGFVGNVALKASEGVASMLTQFGREEFTRNIFTKMAALMSKPVLKAIKARTDPRNYNGASLLGLKGIVVKSHGGADELSFINAIRVTIAEAKNNVPERIEKTLLERQAL